MIMITIYNDDENKALLCGYRCHFSRWVIGAPKSGRRTSLSLASYGFFSHSTSFVYHPLKIFLVFSCPWLYLPSSSIWRWTLAWSNSLTVAGVQLGLHSSSPQGWMVNITSLKLIYLLPRVYGGVGCDWNTTQPDYDGEGAGGASTLPLSSPWGLSTFFI